MYVTHPSFSPPASDDARLWRYVSLAKFLDMIQQEALYFSRPDKLGDAWEGTFSPQWFLDQFLDFAQGQRPLTKDQLLEYAKNASDGRKYMKAEMAITGVNCWHHCGYESAAMWGIYAASGDGLAIQSTFGRLKASFARYRHHVHVGTVHYVDHIADPFPNDEHFDALLRKRMAFDYEREVRAMTMPYGSFDDSPDPPKLGWHISVDLKQLIEQIVIAPRQHEWFVELIRNSVDRYGLDPELVHPSSLDLAPPDLG